MNLELKFYLILTLLVALVLGFLWVTGRKNLVYKIMEKIEFIYHSEFGQKKASEALVLLNQYIDLKFGKYAFIKNFILFCLPEKYVLKTMEKLAPKINETVKPLAQLAKEKTTEVVLNKISEKLDLSDGNSKENIVALAQNLKMESKDKAFFVAEAGIDGNTAREGVNYYAKAGVGIKV